MRTDHCKYLLPNHHKKISKSDTKAAKEKRILATSEDACFNLHTTTKKS